LIRAGLRAYFNENGEKPFRADPIVMKWIIVTMQGIAILSSWIPQYKVPCARQKLIANLEVRAPEIALVNKMPLMGTELKFAFALRWGQEVENGLGSQDGE